MSIISGVKNSVASISSFLNQPIIKEGVKNVAGAATFVFGLAEVYDLYQILRGRSISTEAAAAPTWKDTAVTVTIVCAKISLILSATTSRPGVFVISSLAGQLFTTAQLEGAFGANTIFAVNPWHPRHVTSIAAVILALPTMTYSAYRGAAWLYHRVVQHQAAPGSATNNQTWLTDAKVRAMTLFNTITSRPVLHLGNQFSRVIVA
jgi:hypothetical protein